MHLVVEGLLLLTFPHCNYLAHPCVSHLTPFPPFSQCLFKLLDLPLHTQLIPSHTANTFTRRLNSLFAMNPFVVSVAHIQVRSRLSWDWWTPIICTCKANDVKHTLIFAGIYLSQPFNLFIFFASSLPNRVHKTLPADFYAKAWVNRFKSLIPYLRRQLCLVKSYPRPPQPPPPSPQHQAPNGL